MKSSVICIIPAAILSVLLVVLLIVTPIVAVFSSLVEQETIKEIITSIDFTQFFLSDTQKNVAQESVGALCTNLSAETFTADTEIIDGDIPRNSTADQIQKTLGESGIPVEAVNAIMKTQAVSEIIDALADEVSVYLTGGTQADNPLNSDTIKTIINDNIDEIVDVSYEFIQDKDEISKESLKNSIQKEIDVRSDKINEDISDLKEAAIKNVSKEVKYVIKLAKSDLLTIINWSAIVILSLLIFVLRLSGGRGFIWLTIIFFLGAAFTSVLYFVFDKVVIRMIEIFISDFNIKPFLPAFSVITGSMGKFALIFAGIAIACLIAYIIIKNITAKNKKTAN